MVNESWILLKRATLLVGIALSLFAVIEVLHGYQVLAALHPALGYSFLALMTLLIVAFGLMIARALLALPRALVPPQIGPLENASSNEIVRYQNYLGAYLSRLCDNEALSLAQRTACKNARDELVQIDKDDLAAELPHIEDVVVSGVNELEKQARVAVHDCVRDIMLLVSVSPYRAADLLIVLYRNGAMVMNIMRIFYMRPNLRTQAAIFRDILRVVATVNYLNMGEKLIESLAGKIPFVGQVVDDVSQGLGAGIMTSTVGHAAIQRCSAFRGWDPVEGADSMRSMIGSFVLDVGRIFADDVVGPLHSRLGAQWETVRRGVIESIGNLAATASDFVTRPAVSVGTGMATGGAAILSGAASAVRLSAGLGRKAGGTAGTLVLKAGKTVASGAQVGGRTTLHGAQITTQRAAALANSAWSGTVQIAKSGTNATFGTAQATANLVVRTSKSVFEGSLGIGKSFSRRAFKRADNGSLAAAVVEERDEFVIELKVPGVRKEGIHLAFEKQRLIVQTDKTERDESTSCIIDLPESVDSASASARLEGGILTVRVPKERRHAS